MRPLNKLKPAAPEFTYPIHNVLMNALGDFCNICERKLYDVALVWNKEKDMLESGVVSSRQWNQLLLLCHNCAENHVRHQSSVKQLLLPDQAVTFRLNNDSPFIYELKKASTNYTDDKGKIISQAEGDAVIVSGNTTEAQNTIRTFALNTPFYNEDSGVFTIPMALYLSLEDRRVEFRTKAWHNALVVGGVLNRLSGDNAVESRALIINIRHQLLATGFWSTWITALHLAGVSMESINAVLNPEPDPASKNKMLKNTVAARQETIIGPGAHNPMPGTNQEWMQ